MKIRILKISALVISVSLGCFLICVFLYHRVHVNMERAFLEQFDTGEILEIEGTKVNYKVFNAEKTERTVVLMPGLGVQDLSIAGKPLADRINARIILVNRPGYAFSDETGYAADVDYIVEYHRNLLKELGVTEPVVLMPHSIAGQYAMYWAERYPDEVEGIIGLDIGSPYRYLSKNDENSLVEGVKYVGAKLGWGRIIMSKADYAPYLADFGYLSEAERVAMWYLNGTINPYPQFVKSETLLTKANAQKVIETLSNNYHAKPKLLIAADYLAEDFESKARTALLEAFRGDNDAVEKHLAKHREEQDKIIESFLNNDERTVVVRVPGTHGVYLYPSDTLATTINDFLN